MFSDVDRGTQGSFLSAFKLFHTQKVYISKVLVKGRIHS